MDADAGCAYEVTDWRSISCGVAMCAGACESFSLRCRHVLRFLLRKRSVANGEFENIHVPSAEQHADYRVKSLHTEAFCRLHASGEYLARGLL